MIKTFHVDTPGQGLHDITSRVRSLLKDSGLVDGLCTLFVRHTSASLLIQENADPTAKSDLERWLNRLVPDGDPFYEHDAEGIFLWEHRRRGSRREIVLHIGA